MRQVFFRTACLMVLAGVSGGAIAQAGSFGLVRADLVKVEDISAPLQEGEIRLDGEMRLTFRVRKILVGTVANKVIVHTQWSGMPYRGEMYVLVRNDGTKPKVEWWHQARDGLCFDGEARDYGMEEQVRRIEKSHPCRRKN